MVVGLFAQYTALARREFESIEYDLVALLKSSLDEDKLNHARKQILSRIEKSLANLATGVRALENIEKLDEEDFEEEEFDG